MEIISSVEIIRIGKIKSLYYDAQKEIIIIASDN
jgi:hypothetical protein